MRVPTKYDVSWLVLVYLESSHLPIVVAAITAFLEPPERSEGLGAAPLESTVLCAED